MFEKYKDDLITVNELMEILYIGKNKAYNLLKNGEIYAIKVGSTWRIPLDSIKEFIGYKSKTAKERFII